jgi:hypothetical protein
MQKIVKIICESDAYDIREVAPYSMSVEEAINRLQELPKDAQLAFSLGGGYTFGRVKHSDFRLIELESIEEEKEREKKEEEEWDKECEWYDHLSKKVSDQFEDKDWLGEEETCTILSEIVGKECRCYDHCIDDGCDDEEDTHIIKACFDFSNSPIKIRMYYGNNTEKIGYVDFQW